MKATTPRERVAETFVIRLEKLIRAIVDDKVTYKEDGNFLEVEAAKDDMYNYVLTRFQQR